MQGLRRKQKMGKHMRRRTTRTADCIVDGAWHHLSRTSRHARLRSATRSAALWACVFLPGRGTARWYPSRRTPPAGSVGWSPVTRSVRGLRQWYRAGTSGSASSPIDGRTRHSSHPRPVQKLHARTHGMRVWFTHLVRGEVSLHRVKVAISRSGLSTSPKQVSVVESRPRAA